MLKPESYVAHVCSLAELYHPQHKPMSQAHPEMPGLKQPHLQAPGQRIPDSFQSNDFGRDRTSPVPPGNQFSKLEFHT